MTKKPGLARVSVGVRLGVAGDNRELYCLNLIGDSDRLYVHIGMIA